MRLQAQRRRGSHPVPVIASQRAGHAVRSEAGAGTGAERTSGVRGAASRTNADVERANGGATKPAVGTAGTAPATAGVRRSDRDGRRGPATAPTVGDGPDPSRGRGPGPGLHVRETGPGTGRSSARRHGTPAEPPKRGGPRGRTETRTTGRGSRLRRLPTRHLRRDSRPLPVSTPRHPSDAGITTSGATACGATTVLSTTATTP